MERVAKTLLLMEVFFIFALQFVEAIIENQTYVYAVPTTPFDGNESMAVTCPTRECYSLQDISETYNFKSNTTLVLLPGVHNITRNTTLEISNLQNFAIIRHKESSIVSNESHTPVIWCSNSHFTFTVILRNITGVLLSGFEIYSCSGVGPELSYSTLNDHYTSKHQTMSVFIGDSSNIVIDSVHIYHSSTVGIWLRQVHGNVDIRNSEFSHNKVNCMLFLTDKNATFGNTSIHLTIANTVFSFSRIGEGHTLIHGVSIEILVPNSRYEISIRNVTVQNDDIEGKLKMDLSSSFEMTSILNIHKLKILSSVNNKERLQGKRLAQMFINKNEELCYHYGGLHFELSGGTVKVNLSDSNFTGPGSCVRAISLKHASSKVYFNKTLFTNVHCKCGPLNIEKAYRGTVELNDVMTVTSSQPITVIQSNVTLNGNCSFQQNDGSSLLLNDHSTLIIGVGSNVTFKDNDCSMSTIHCPIFIAESSEILILENTTLIFRNNSATGVLVLHQSNLEILGNTRIVFDNNSGKNGGALSLYARSKIKVCSTETNLFLDSACTSKSKLMSFLNNHASGKGGAIFIDDSSYFSPLVGLEQFQLHALKVRDVRNLRMEFINNTADIAGSALYGGWIVYKLKLLQYNFSPSLATLYFYSEPDDLSVVSSNPVRVCMCVSSVPECSITEHQVNTYPGRTVQLDVVAVGQSYGTVPSIVHAELKSNLKTYLSEGQYVQEVYRNCTTLRYNIFSSDQFENMTLTVTKENTPDLNRLITYLNEYMVYSNGFWIYRFNSLKTEISTLQESLSVIISFNECPLGFSFNFTSKKCLCHPILNKYNSFECDIETLLILKPSQKWINATFIHNLENDIGVIVNDHCPFDYCRQNTTHISLDLEHPDDQCDFNRSGILCGGCQNNFSHVLGTSKCKKCSSLWTILLVPVVAIVGVLLIVAMLGLNLTVSTGMLNGLILFANILRANYNTFFNSNSFLSYFIAWLNLDLGIEMCFYDGLDAYVKTWLQFIFPLYIWTIMIILIALSRRYVFVVRLCGSNVVQVLATLFLLSYAKLIRTIITIFQSTTLAYPDGYKRRVWLYDGNVDYLRGKHIPLFITGLLVLLFLSIPYTVSLLFIQWLRKYNHHRLLHWVGKLKPLFDAYTGPFKEKHCYWFGVLLLVRVALYLVFSLNVPGDTSLNLMAISTTTLCIFSYLVLVGGVYESTLANMVDVSLMLNLGILTTGTHFYGNPLRMSTVSVSIAFCQFILITLYHLYLRITETRKGRQWNETLQTKLKQIFTSQRVVASVREYFAPPVQARREQITHHTIELREPLLVDVTANTQK